MAVAVAIPQAERDAWNAGGAAFLGSNVAQENASSPPMIGSMGVDEADPLYPSSLMTDYSFAHFARPLSGGTINNVTATLIPSPDTFIDTAVIYLDALGGSTAVAVTIDSEILAPNVLVQGARRAVFTNLDFRFHSVSNLTVIAAGSWISEVWVGRRLQLSRPFTAPWDNRPLGAEVREFVSAARSRRQAIYGWGFQDHRGLYEFSGQDQFGLDDLATLRALQDQSMGGARPVLFRPFVGNTFLLGRISVSQLPLQGWVKRQWNMSFVEDSPPAYRELGLDQVPISTTGF